MRSQGWDPVNGITVLLRRHARGPACSFWCVPWGDHIREDDSPQIRKRALAGNKISQKLGLGLLVSRDVEADFSVLVCQIITSPPFSQSSFWNATTYMLKSRNEYLLTSYFNCFTLCADLLVFYRHCLKIASLYCVQYVNYPIQYIWFCLSSI